MVRAFRETHEIEASPVLISAGVYRISREIIEDLPEAPSFLEFDLFPKLCMSGGLGHITVAGWFLDVGLPHALEQAQVDIPKRSLRPCVFFDRDNTLIHDKGYVHRPEDLVWIDGARDVIRGLNDAGWLVIVCTNQAGVAHGYYDEAAVDRFHLELTTSLAEIGAFIDAYFYCPFHEDAKLPNYRRDHEDRKPRPGMILRAIETCSIDASRSLMIGDRRSDAEAGVAAGIAGHIYAGGRLDAFVAGLPELSGVITYRREGQGQEVPGSQARENNQAD